MDFLLRELRSYERYKLIEPLSCNPCFFANMFSSEFVELFRLIGQRRSSQLDAKTSCTSTETAELYINKLY